MRSRKDTIGAVFGRWTVIGEQTTERKVLCKCDCGEEKFVYSSNLTSGKTLSCGCLRKELTSERTKKHGASGTYTYSSWYHMMNRCNNPKNDHYKNYGGRGITVCDEWTSYERFLADMGERPEGMSIERIDNSLGYSKENCKWATQVEQMANTRQVNFVEYQGKTVPLKHVADNEGLPYETLRHRLIKGLSLEQAINHQKYSSLI